MVGRIQAAYMLAPLVMDLADRGIPLKIVSLGHRCGAVTMVRNESPYQNFRQLAGRRVAVPSRFAVDYLFLRRMLAEEDMRIEQLGSSRCHRPTCRLRSTRRQSRRIAPASRSEPLRRADDGRRAHDRQALSASGGELWRLARNAVSAGGDSGVLPQIVVGMRIGLGVACWSSSSVETEWGQAISDCVTA
jgi:hypothetical protein